MLDDTVVHDIAQGISIPIPATQDRLLPPWARIASRFRAHPTGLALLISEQTFQEQTSSCVNNGRIRFLISRSDAAHNASVSSIDAARVHDLRIMAAHGFTSQKSNCNAKAKRGGRQGQHSSVVWGQERFEPL